MLEKYTVKIELNSRYGDDLYTVNSYSTAINLANNKIYGLSPQVKSVRIIKQGRTPGDDVVIAIWEKGWRYVKG
jgi:hypothetical protein